MAKYLLIVMLLGAATAASAAIDYREVCKKAKYKSIATLNSDFQIFACGEGEFATWTLGYWYKNSQQILLPYLLETDLKPSFSKGQAFFIYETFQGVAILNGRAFSFSAKVVCHNSSCRFAACKLKDNKPPLNVAKTIFKIREEINKTKQDDYFKNIHEKNIPQQLAGFAFLGNAEARDLLVKIQKKFGENLDGEAAEVYSDVMTFTNAFNGCY